MFRAPGGRLAQRASRRGFSTHVSKGIAFLSLALLCRPALADSLDSVQLPAVPQKPWQFKQFPIIAWWSPPGTARIEDFQAYKEAGFTLYAANPDSRYDAALDMATRTGLKVIAYRQRQGFGLPDPAVPVDFTKHSKQIIGWITNDEPAGAPGITAAITAVNTLMREDPTRRALFNMLPPAAQHDPDTESVIAAGVRNGLPVLSYDAYVIQADGSDNTTAYYIYLAQFRQASLRNHVPFWAFALSIKHGGYRRPSESDIRWNQYTSLAYGAKGLWYFTYWGPTGWDSWDKRAIIDPTDGSKTELYKYVKTLNHAVLAMGSTLQGLTSTSIVHTNPPPEQQPFTPNTEWIAGIQASDALIGFFQDGKGKRYALVVNKRHGMNKSAAEMADTITLTFAPGIRSVTAINWLDGTPGRLKQDQEKATLRLSGGTGVLLRADP